ncbi:MAG: endolytic transglycosylase MltG, partial [Petrimonas sp.]|nr:endolytic transglycosylase MltG [Petrimonas sp.]
IGLSPVQVSTLASIVEEEATYSDEYPVVAGLYLNRLKKGMRLEADPTVKFAVGDFSLRRILFRHLEVESPYNTYRNTGLPPGPIRIPSIQAIDGTLSPQQHNYLFMCAKEDLSGRHNFAATHAEHSRNAARYQRALNERGIF